MFIKTALTLFILIFSPVTTKPFQKPSRPATCQACHPIDVEKINVHLVPHSHDDVGWLKTVDQYYYGTKKHIQYAGVQYIISSSLAALKGHPNRRYVQVESAFFWKWWQHQEDASRQNVVELVNSGQLEIINGAWSMNDEAAVHYHSTIDQFTWGLRFLNDTLGECARPKIGWQIDPFGHSREHASLMTQMGFQGLVIGRIDYRDKRKRKAEKNLDFIWQGSANLNNSNIFTTMFPDFYLNVPGFCFDVLCDDEPINDEVNSPDYNLKKKVDDFAVHMDEFRKYYKTSNILVPMGGDFNFQAAEINFANLDKLVRGFENHPTYNVFYSTPSCYVRAVNDEVNSKSITLTKKTDDFFPYASENHAFWTGYFTSRPTSKRFERLGNNILQATKQLTAFSKVIGSDEEEFITPLREAMGVMQHHDAITGTEKEAVAKDYARLLTQAIKSAEEPVGFIIGNLLKKNSQNEINLDLHSCLLTNVSICEATKKDSFIVVVYNPLAKVVTHYVRLPVDDVNYRISGPDGEEEYEIFDNLYVFDHVKESIKPSDKEIVFASKQVPPLGLKLYYVKKTEENTTEHYRPFENLKETMSFGTETNGFTIDGNTGRLVKATIRGMTLDITQDFYYYNGFTGGRSGNYRSSGAYTFRPTTTEAKPVNDDSILVKFRKGKLIDEVFQQFNSEITQTIRVYKGDDDGYIEFDWLVGDLKFDNYEGKEIITRFITKDFNNEGVFFTDSNGREMIKRQLNTRSDYEYDHSEEPVTSNYYPVTSKIVIKDENRSIQVAVLNDRAQGGSSLKNGVIELMVHRRLLRDDGFGVDEALNEKEYDKGLFARGQHYLTFGPTNSNTAFEKDLARRKLLAPWVLLDGFTDEKYISLEEMQNVFNFKFGGLTKSLPDNVHLLTLEPWRDDTYILRLEHIYEKSEDEKLSKPITVDLTGLFNIFDISEIGETTLAANQWLDDYKEEEKLIWNEEIFQPMTELDRNDPLKIELNPMQIRTLIVKVLKK